MTATDTTSAADWRDIPRGHYAEPVTRYDIDDSLDELDEASYAIVGYKLYERKVSKITKTGRRIGHDRWVGPRLAVLEGGTMAAQDLRDAMCAAGLLDRGRLQHDIEMFLINPRMSQEIFGQFTGRCGKCGRPLTDPDSKMRGIGPDCAGLRGGHGRIAGAPKATIVQHCAVFGDLESPAREFKVSEVQPYAQHERTVTVSFVEPRKRKGKYLRMVPDNIRYLTIHNQDGETVYDSRDDIPCDMDEFNATVRRFRK